MGVVAGVGNLQGGGSKSIVPDKIWCRVVGAVGVVVLNDGGLIVTRGSLAGGSWSRRRGGCWGRSRSS